MASLLDRALSPELPQEGDGEHRSGIDRVLRTTFWRTTAHTGTAHVIQITTGKARGLTLTRDDDKTR